MDSNELSGRVVAIYARFSSENQRDASIDEQVERCRAWIEARGGTVARELVFADHAQSGGGADRPQYMQLLKLASAPRSVDVIVVEELARLSRDDAELFTTKRMLNFEGVRLVGVADGIDTHEPNGALAFSLKAIISSTYSRELADKTKRGLVGRARHGFSTGGRTFGYSTQPEAGPNGQSIGHRRVIDASQASVVVKIFELYRDGHSLSGIAKVLNANGAPPPRGDHPGRRARGWVATTVRHILHNPIYIGRWSYNAREWRKQPGTNKRRYRARASQELITTEDPSLRIIDQELWDTVEQRLEQVRAYYTKDSAGRSKGRAIAGGATPYLFSKLLKCGLCGSAMVVSGGSATAYYRCGDHVKRGTCKNSLGVREDVLRDRLLEELRHTLARPAGLAFARKCIAERLGKIERERRAGLDERRRHAADVAAKLDSLVDFVAGGQAKGNYAAIRARMESLEAEKAAADRAVREVQRQSVEPVPLPTPDEMLELAFDLDARLRGDTLRGREELRGLFKDGLITLIPQASGYYLARSEVLPLVLITRPPPEGGGTRSLVARGGFEPPTFGL